jgi:hypothetical protein
MIYSFFTLHIYIYIVKLKHRRVFLFNHDCFGDG